MQKKLVAVAVAGALGMPVVALAQNATVNIYGTMYMEYGFVKQGANATGLINRVDNDNIQTGGSEVGFRGEEKLGGGMSAWFQCASTADPRGQSVAGWCSRDSALGIKGNFGNFYMGNWGTPFKRARIYTGAGDTGHFGVSGLLTGHSTTAPDGASPQLFARRQNNLISYDTPNFGGFMGMASYTSTNNSTSKLETNSNTKPRLWSIAGQYANGPLKVTAAYEVHKDMLGAGAAQGASIPGNAAPAFSGDEHGWLVAGSYTFANKLTLGGMYTRQTWDTVGGGLPAGAVGESHVNAWHIGIDWKISGPHGMRASYTSAGDVSGLGAAATGGLRPAAGPNTGAKMYQVRYVHQLSKRSELTFGYNAVDNDNAAGYNINGNGGTNSGTGGGNGLGGKHSVFAIGMLHKF